MKNLKTTIIALFISISYLNAQQPEKFVQSYKFGYKDKKGNVVIQPIYNMAHDFYKGVASVKLDKKWALIDTKGTSITSFKYDNINNREENQNYYLVAINYKWGILNLAGKEIVEPKYDVIFNLYKQGIDKNYLRVYLDKKWGLIDTNGRAITPIKYQEISQYIDGYAKVKLNDKWIRIDEKGREITESQVADKLTSDGNSAQKPRSDGFLKNYDEASKCGMGEELYRVRKGNKWGLITKDGKVIVAPKYDEIYDEFNLWSWNIARTSLNGKKGYIGAYGEIAAPKYDFADKFNKTVAKVGIKDSKGEYKYGFINTTGKEFIPLIYIKTEPNFKDDKVLVTKRKGNIDSLYYIGYNGKILNVVSVGASEELYAGTKNKSSASVSGNNGTSTQKFKKLNLSFNKIYDGYASGNSGKPIPQKTEVIVSHTTQTLKIYVEGKLTQTYDIVESFEQLTETPPYRTAKAYYCTLDYKTVTSFIFGLNNTGQEVMIAKDNIRTVTFFAEK